ncbi:MAG: adenosylcobinamide-phosphate synthase CbiB [Desulfobacterales bacterium]|jgi:adenosylcobinamide-phosphate synthase|nr:adenosylcobinamide-phosphate synthase CbiB [Desulfobacterales bacterium]
MIPLTLQIWLALCFDFLMGDPGWLPHPVRLIGRVAQLLEKPARRLFLNERLAGAVTAAIVIGGTAWVTWGLLRTAHRLSPLMGDLAAIGILYTTFAAKDLSAHSRAVWRALEAGNLAQARRAAARMVGRDTAGLEAPGVIRAAVESVAENTVDGVLAPLFFAFLFGPVGAMTYKAINTLDSTFGYRNDRYRHFGWASARIDDAANYIPARLSLVFIAIGALFTGGRCGRTFGIGLRDARKHASPNSGYAESAFAGALGVQLGGPLLRNGHPEATPLLGDAIIPLGQNHILSANLLMSAALISATVLMSGARLLVEAILK